ncbi:hypothetical protein N9L68_03200 [bacterium]|nr:hypothetical protein [bacterium]
MSLTSAQCLATTSALTKTTRARAAAGRRSPVPPLFERTRLATGAVASRSFAEKRNQFKRQGSCAVSRLAGWSKFSMESGGGAKSRSRCTPKQLKNGGMSCYTAHESRACHTDSCYRGRKLNRLSKWSPCPVAYRWR